MFRHSVRVGSNVLFLTALFPGLEHSAWRIPWYSDWLIVGCMDRWTGKRTDQGMNWLASTLVRMRSTFYLERLSSALLLSWRPFLNLHVFPGYLCVSLSTGHLQEIEWPFVSWNSGQDRAPVLCIKNVPPVQFPALISSTSFCVHHFGGSLVHFPSWALLWSSQCLESVSLGPFVFSREESSNLLLRW